jgi:hypothetical protein
MEILYNFFEIIKGNNGTWAQAILNGLVLNIRVVFGLVVSIYFYKKIYNLKSFESLLLMISLIIMMTECRFFYERRIMEVLHNQVSYYGKDTDNLIIVVQGANNPFTDTVEYNKTQVDFTNSRDTDGLGLIEKRLTSFNTKVLTYVGTHSYTFTPEDVYETIYYYRMYKPKGKIILVGHSIGGHNLTQVLDKLNDNNVSVDLVMFLDNADKLHNNFDYKVKSNVKCVINFTSPKWADNFYFFTNAGGIVSRDDKNNFTNILNLKIPKTTHTSIDNKIPKDISNIINNYLKNDSNPIDFTKKYKF